jgi:hypothetical protein
LTNAAVGGAALNSYCPAVLGGIGPNNVGSLVAVCGRVTAVGSGFYYVDDGSGVTDPRINTATGRPYSGIKVIDAVRAPEVDDYWMVTGIATVEVNGSDLIRTILSTDSRQMQ